MSTHHAGTPITLTYGQSWTVLAVIVAVAIMGFVAGVCTMHMATPAHYPACSSEDAPGPCYWDASTRGTPGGTSFYVHADQTTTYTR